MKTTKYFALLAGTAIFLSPQISSAAFLEDTWNKLMPQKEQYELDLEKAELKSKIKETEAELSRLAKIRNENLKKIKELTRAMDKVHSERTKLRVDIGYKKINDESLQTEEEKAKLRAADEALEKSKKEIAEVHAANQRIVEEGKEVNNARKELEKELRKLEAQIDKRRNQIDSNAGGNPSVAQTKEVKPWPSAFDNESEEKPEKIKSASAQ